MQIARIILRVADLRRAVGFWSDQVGLSVTAEGGAFAFLDGGGIQLALNEVGADVEDPSLTEIVLEAEDVVAAHAELADRGVPFEVDLRPVTSEETRDLMASHFRDPDGHLASLTGWVEKERPAAG